MEDCPLKVMTEPRSESSMALTRPGVEGETSHAKRARIAGKGVTVRKKMEVVTVFLALHPILKRHVLDHVPHCSHFIWTPFMGLEFPPCARVQYDPLRHSSKTRSSCVL